ncbi:MAG: hypothetical protein IPO88_05295 [Nannocystis sp.]|uniref:hypothetical protein n=1 Tax=Nannocystis sp. TaxID=1962667 RepID=UPI002421DECB|nr:hypothetical protein [Nannocystis sp.]MBK9752916.1 hypothetical protein [Nannocystis sp.]
MSALRSVARAAILFGVVAFLGVGACAQPTEVELRLYPCELGEGPPLRVDLEVVGYDASGAAMPPLTRSFDIPDPGVLADGYATVGLHKPDGMVEAAFTLTWTFPQSVAAQVELPRRPLPAAGEVLELGADSCTPVGGSTGTSTGDSDASTSSGGSSSGGQTGDASTSGGSSSTSTSGDTSTSTGSDSSGGGSSTGEPSMLGDPCDDQNDSLFCENAGPGKLGNALYCMGGTWQPADLINLCKPLSDYCPTMMLTDAVPIGCTNEGVDGFSCACRDEPAMDCVPADVGCDGNVNITLCTDDGDKQIRVKGLCIGLCMDVGQGPYCVPN